MRLIQIHHEKSHTNNVYKYIYNCSLYFSFKKSVENKTNYKFCFVEVNNDYIPKNNYISNQTAKCDEPIFDGNYNHVSIGVQCGTSNFGNNSNLDFLYISNSCHSPSTSHNPQC